MFTLSRFFCLFALWLPVTLWAASADYDPLKIAEPSGVLVKDISIQDKARNREIPIRVYLPKSEKPAPVILFSHGLGGSREGYPYVGQHWAARGYVVVHMQHIGSDTSVWKGKAVGTRMSEASSAANAKNLQLRIKDVSATLDQLEKWNATEGHALAGRLDMKHVGMSGHSFGAITTQAVSGESSLLASRGASSADPRILAAIPMSPSEPTLGDSKRAFANVKIPWLVMTGTEDSSPIGNASPESRQKVYPALPAGDKYELVLDGAQHSAFGGGNSLSERMPNKQNPNHHKVILALSTAFWDTYLRGDADAKAWLQGDGPSKVMEPKDRWQKK